MLRHPDVERRGHQNVPAPVRLVGDDFRTQPVRPEQARGPTLLVGAHRHDHRRGSLQPGVDLGQLDSARSMEDLGLFGRTRVYGILSPACTRRSPGAVRAPAAPKPVQNSAVTPVRGFILQASYRVESRGRTGSACPVIHLYGRLESGGTFLVRDDRPRPHFFIRASDADRARALGAPEPRAADQRTFDGASVCSIEVATPPEVPGVRDRLQAAGLATFEADVRFATRYLIDRGIKGGCEIEGEARRGDGRRPGCSTTRRCGRRT